MKIFLDTNIFIEYIEERLEVETVAEILNAIAEGKHQGFLSQGCWRLLLMRPLMTWRTVSNISVLLRITVMFL